MANYFTTLGSVTVHRLKSGATVQLYLSANKSLHQIVDTTAKTVGPSWKNGAGPVITPILTGGTIVSAMWCYDYDKTAKDAAAREATNIVTLFGNKVTVDGTTGKLTFNDNIVSGSDVVMNHTLTFICSVTTGGAATPIERSVVIDVRSGGANSYWGHIDASNGTTLGKRFEGDNQEIASTTLKPILTLGTEVLDINTYSVKWYRTGGSKTGKDVEITSSMNAESDGVALGINKTLIVYRNGVNSSAHFEAHFYVNGVKVEAEGIQITDNADQYFIGISGDTSVYDNDLNNRVVLTAEVFETQTNAKITNISDWLVVASDTERMHEYIDKTHFSYELKDNNSKCVFEMTVGNMFVPNTQTTLEYTDFGEKQDAYPEAMALSEESASSRAATTAGINKKIPVVHHTDWRVPEKPWIKCGNSEAEDVAVATTAQATECDVVVQFMAVI